MGAPEPPLAGRQGPGPQDMWRHRSPLQQGGRVRGRMTRGGVRAHPSREAGFDAAGHVAALEPTPAGRQPPEP
jgi:hypothetical protein